MNETAGDQPVTAEPAAPAPAAAGVPAAPAPAAAGVPAAPPPGPAMPAAGAGASDPYADLRRERDEYRRQVEQYRPLAEMGYRSYQAEQQAARQRQMEREQAERSRPWVDLPKFERQLMQFVARDPSTGELVAKPGAPPDLLARYQEFQQRYEETAWNLVTAPEKVLADPIRQLVAAEAAGIVREQMAEYQRQQQVQGILRDNSSWLFAPDPGPAGRPVLSEAGRLFHLHVQEAAAMGIADDARQAAYARRQLEADLIRLLHQRAGAAPTAAAASAAQKDGFLNAAGANRPAAAPPSAPPAAGLSPGAGGDRAVAATMMARLRAAGISDDHVFTG
jgi:hypothetical protein